MGNSQDKNITTTPNNSSNRNKENNNAKSPTVESNQNINNNQQINIESPPARTNDQILSPAYAINIPQNSNYEIKNINVVTQFQQVPIRPGITQNQTVLPNGVIIINQAPIQKVRNYSSSKITCPFCQLEVYTVPENVTWTCQSCNSCTEIVCLNILFCGLPIFIALCCGEDLCCYEADHRCPKCKKIIAQRAERHDLQDCCESLIKSLMRCN